MSRPRKSTQIPLDDDDAPTVVVGESEMPTMPAPAVPAQRLFVVGEIVAERYRIVRYIDQGAVGEVYEAVDLELDRQRIALKALRPEATSVPAAVERFKREVQLARQVTHPNVCRIYDFGQHDFRDTDTPDRGNVLFLTMELLEGRTLWRHLRDHGPLSTEQALPIAAQMAAGLDAASKAGVTHRDFKTGNVMLVPDPEEEGGERVVITDFGLARADEGKAPARALTQTDSRQFVVGTPAYMAPEQMTGGEVTAAADIYAVGVVLFEMLTGEFPFEGGSSLGGALKRLHIAPKSPREYVPDVDPRWERAVMRCLRLEPEDRYGSGAELIADLTASETSSRIAALGASAAILTALLVGFFWLGPKDDPRRDEAAAIAALSERPTLALLGLRNLAGDPQAQWLSAALTEMLAMEAAASEGLRIVPGENVAEMQLELGLDLDDVLTPQQLRGVAERLGAELGLIGSYLRSPSGDVEIRLDLQIKHLQSGEILGRVSERGSEAELLDLVETTGRSLRETLGLEALSEQAAAEVRASMPSSVEATKLYAEGLRALRLYDAQKALDLLRRAADSDPENALIRTALSAAWATLGYWSNAKEQSRRAFDLADRLGEKDRRWVTARYHEAAGDRREAVEIYRSLWAEDPDDFEAGARLASAQVSIRAGEDALATAEKLRVLAPEEPRVDLLIAGAARTTANYALQQEAAERARAKAEARGARLLMARAWEIEAGAWRDLGEPDNAKAAYESARKILAAAGHRGAVARSMIAVAKIHRYHGRFAEATDLVEEALVIAREIGDQGTIEHGLNLMALILRQQGHLREARDMHERELAANRETGDDFGVQVTMTSLGMVERRMGDLARARETFEEGLLMAREAGNKRSIAINLHNYGEVLLRQGEIAEAKRCFEEALKHNADTKTRRGRAYYLSRLGETALIENDLPTARRFAEEAFEIRREIDERTNLAYSRLALAEIELAQGHLEEALQQALAAAEELASQDAPDSTAQAWSMVARIHFAGGRNAEARSAIQRADELLQGSENRGVLLQTGIDAARVRGDSPETRERLEQIIVEARELSFRDRAIEASILLGQFEADAGEGRARLDAAREEALRRGFLRMGSV